MNKNSIKTLNNHSWKIEHRGDGLSFIGFPYLDRSGNVQYGWTLGPFDKYVAEWLFDAITKTQKKNNE